MYHDKYLKYKIKYNQLKNKLFGGRIPIIENLVIPDGLTKQTYLENMKRKDFLDNVALLFDMQKSKSSIKDTQGHYIHYVPGSIPYKLTDSCMLTLESSTTPEQNEILESNPKKHYKDFFNSYINIGSHKIPYVYLFINQVEIFNFIIIIFKHNFKDKDALKDIINFDKEFNFIGLSYRFNIFNLSLFTNTFFEIVKLILDKLELSTEINNEDIKTELKDIYKIKKNMIINLYDLIFYKFCLNIIKKQNEKLYETELNKLDVININPSVPYTVKCLDFIKTEEATLYNNVAEETEKKYNNIINILANQLLLIINILNIGQKLFNNKDISKVFLFAILSYRLTNRYIYGTWAFSPKYVLEYFNGNKSTEILSEELKLEKESVMLQPKRYFYEEDIYIIKPNFVNTYLSLNLVEYSRVSYKNKTFSNCVENAFLQFLKVIFWNDEIGEYNFDKIKQKIKEEYQQKIYEILQETKDYDETSQNFSDKWLDFLYNLIKPKFKSDTCELCSCDITNLYEFLYKLFKINIKELTISNIDFFRLIDDKLSMESNNDTTINIILSDGLTITNSPSFFSAKEILLKYEQYTLEITVSHSRVFKNDRDNTIYIETINEDFSIILKYHNILKYKYFLLLLLLQYFNNEHTQPIVFNFIMKYLYVLDQYIDFVNKSNLSDNMSEIYQLGIINFLKYLNTINFKLDIPLLDIIAKIKWYEIIGKVYKLWNFDIILEYISSDNNITSKIGMQLLQSHEFQNDYLDKYNTIQHNNILLVDIFKGIIDKLNIPKYNTLEKQQKIYNNLLYLIENNKDIYKKIIKHFNINLLKEFITFIIILKNNIHLIYILDNLPVFHKKMIIVKIVFTEDLFNLLNDEIILHILKNNDDENIFNKLKSKIITTTFDKLEELEFGDDFNNNMDFLIAPNLKKIKFGKSFNQPINNTFDKLEELEFGDNFNEKIDFLIAPNLKKIKFGKSFNQPINNTFDKLEELEFGDDFNNNIKYLKTFKYLRKVIFGTDFNKNIGYGSLNKKNIGYVKKIKSSEEFLGGSYSNITYSDNSIIVNSDSIENNITESTLKFESFLPISLEELYFGNNFNRILGFTIYTINKTISNIDYFSYLPANLKKLIFGNQFTKSISDIDNILNTEYCKEFDTIPKFKLIDNTTKEKEILNTSLSYLPQQLEELEFGEYFTHLLGTFKNEKVYKYLPNSLKQLRIYSINYPYTQNNRFESNQEFDFYETIIENNNINLFTYDDSLISFFLKIRSEIDTIYMLGKIASIGRIFNYDTNLINDYIILQVITEYPDAILNIDKNDYLWKDNKFIYSAVAFNVDVLKHIDINTRQDIEILLLINPKAIKYITNLSNKLLLYYIEYNPNIIEYIPEHLERILEIIPKSPYFYSKIYDVLIKIINETNNNIILEYIFSHASIDINKVFNDLSTKQFRLYKHYLTDKSLNSDTLINILLSIDNHDELLKYLQSIKIDDLINILLSQKYQNFISITMYLLNKDSLKTIISNPNINHNIKILFLLSIDEPLSYLKYLPNDNLIIIKETLSKIKLQDFKEKITKILEYDNKPEEKITKILEYDNKPTNSSLHYMKPTISSESHTQSTRPKQSTSFIKRVESSNTPHRINRP